MVAVDSPAKRTYNDKFLGRLRNSLKASRKIMKEALAHRETIMNAYIGAHYGKPQGQDKRPINKVQQAILIYTRLLAAKNPRVMIRCKSLAYKRQATVFEAVMNNLLAEIRMEQELRLCAMDATMSWGMMKVGLAPAGFCKVGDFEFDPGQPYASRVSPDYCFLDLHARTWAGMQYMGDLGLRDFESMKESKQYQNLEKIDPEAAPPMSEHGQTRAENISHGKRGPEDRIYDEVEILELFVPRDSSVLTLSYPDYHLLKVEEYDGPERGPYEYLAFGECPDQILALPPAQAWLDLDDAVNRLTRKLVRQAERQKTILAYHGADAKDASRIVDADDGGTIRLDNPNVQASTKEISFGGPRPENNAMVLQLLTQINSLTGNIEMLAGIAPGSATVGQDQLLAQQQGVQMDDMRNRMVDFTNLCVEKLAWYRWNHMSEKLVKLQVQGTDIEYEEVFSPINKEGDLFDFDIRIEPYSMQPSSPQQEYMKLQNLLTGVLMPLAPVFQSAGVTFDAHALVKMMARYNDILDLDSILQAAAPMPMAGGQGDATAPKPPNTTRTYVRENRPTSVPRTESAEMAKIMMGATKNQGANT